MNVGRSFDMNKGVSNMMPVEDNERTPEPADKPDDPPVEGGEDE